MNIDKSLVMPKSYKQDDMDLIVSEVISADGEELYLFSAMGMSTGIAVSKLDYDSGDITEQQVAEMVGEMFINRVRPVGGLKPASD